MSDPAYTDLARASRHTIGIGGALISLVEPHPGTEKAYNRWYEDDHFYAGALFMPWLFAGRRFVATRELQGLRYPDPSPIASPLNAGCYLHLYWITPDHVDDHIRWSVSTNVVLRAEGRIHLERTHVYTSFQDHVGSFERAPDGPPDCAPPPGGCARAPTSASRSLVSAASTVSDPPSRLPRGDGEKNCPASFGSPACPRARVSPGDSRLFTIPETGVHDPEMTVHDPRNECSRWSETGDHVETK